MSKGFIVIALVFIFVLLFSIPYVYAGSDDGSIGAVYSSQITENAAKQRINAEEQIMNNLKKEAVREEVMNRVRNEAEVNETIQTQMDRVRNVLSESRVNLSIEEKNGSKRIGALLSNGRFAEIKLLPDQASAVALSRLNSKCEENKCVVELKEVSHKGIDRLAYEIKTERKGKLFGLFEKIIKTEAVVDADTGEILSSNKPWWSFLAS